MNYKHGDVIFWINRKDEIFAVDYVLEWELFERGILSVIPLKEDVYIIKDNFQMLNVQTIDIKDGCAKNMIVFHWES